MKRDRLKTLQAWRKDKYRKPLIIRGARQVGKSWLVNTFGQDFKYFISINFEKNKQLHQYFQGDLNLEVVLERLSLYTNTPIIPGETLIFFDEIQTCEPAIELLRYFKEEKPELHIIAAGSLLDFALNKIGIPVGRVQFMYLHPLSFIEYLTVSGQMHLRDFLFTQTHDPLIHDKLLSELKTYMWLGGMPAVVNAWLEDKNPTICQTLQDEIIETYKIDFHKYAKDREIPYITTVFERIPTMLGKKFVYSHVDPDTRIEPIKNALQLLEFAGVAKKCFHTDAQKLPLGAQIKEKKYKVFFFDIGIAQRLLGLDIESWLLNPLQISNQGQVAEQLVGQELIAYANHHKMPALYYWHREAKSSNAEVDFIVEKKGDIIPVEIKSGPKGTMKSMQLFLQSHPNSPYGLKIYEGEYSTQNQLEEIPLYGIAPWLMENQTV